MVDLWNALEYGHDPSNLKFMLQSHITQWNLALRPLDEQPSDIQLPDHLVSTPSESNFGSEFADPGDLIEGQTVSHGELYTDNADYFKQGLNAVNAGSGFMGIEATNVSRQTANLDDFDAPDSLQLPGRRLNAKTLKYPKGDLRSRPCYGCIDTRKECYDVAKSTVLVCWECKISGRKCSYTKTKKLGMFITSPTRVLLKELYRRRDTRDLERIAVRTAKSRCVDR
jgi:hypothetical protein